MNPIELARSGQLPNVVRDDHGLLWANYRDGGGVIQTERVNCGTIDGALEWVRLKMRQKQKASAALLSGEPAAPSRTLQQRMRTHHIKRSINSYLAGDNENGLKHRRLAVSVEQKLRKE